MSKRGKSVECWGWGDGQVCQREVVDLSHGEGGEKRKYVEQSFTKRRTVSEEESGGENGTLGSRPGTGVIVQGRLLR